MKTAALAVALSLTVGSSAFAAERAAKHVAPLVVPNDPSKIHNGIPAQLHPVPAVCTHALVDFLHDLAADSKHMAISPSLSSAQYSFVQDEIKKHSTDHKVASGDGAIVIDSDGQFFLASTLGDPAGVVKVCAIAQIPAELVAAIVAVDAPPKAAEPPPAENSGEKPWL